VLALRPLFAREPFLTTCLIAFARRGLERFASIPVIAARAPAAMAALEWAVAFGAGVFGRGPEFAARKPLHLSIRVLLLDASEGRQEILAIGRTKGGW
jgi:hypothetical protein